MKWLLGWFAQTQLGQVILRVVFPPSLDGGGLGIETRSPFSDGDGGLRVRI